MFEIGRVCVKLAGRDAGKKCVIVDTIDDSYVMIDGMTRRRKCNVKHLEPLAEVMKIRKGASHEAVVEEFKSLGAEIKETKKKERKEKPKKQKRKKAEKTGKGTKEKKVKKQATKKEKTKKAGKTKTEKKPKEEPNKEAK